MAHKITDKCITCDACRLQCPRNAISIADDGKKYSINSGQCNDCTGLSSVRCVPHCPVQAILPA